LCPVSSSASWIGIADEETCTGAGVAAKAVPVATNIVTTAAEAVTAMG
jgi:hypothetical protein